MNDETNWKRNLLLPVLLLWLQISGCASPASISTGASMQLPAKPQSRQPAPPQAYSKSAAENINRWQQQLTDTLPMPTSASQPGRSN